MVVEADLVVVPASLAVALASSVAVEVGRASSGRRFSSALFEVDWAVSERLS